MLGMVLVMVWMGSMYVYEIQIESLNIRIGFDTFIFHMCTCMHIHACSLTLAPRHVHTHAKVYNKIYINEIKRQMIK